MPIGQADLENAVREGWARDEDNELSIDGYSATIQVTTDDGTSGLNLKNSSGAVSFSAGSSGDGYFANKLGVGTFNPETQLEVIGKSRTDELQVTSGAIPGYVLTSDADGNATWQPTGAATSGVSETTFQENKNAQNEINHQIIVALDGYAQDSTVTENKNAQEQINQSILQSLDGYAQYSTESEHYLQLSQAIQDIISTIDGYSTDTELAGLDNTVTENNNQQQQINQSIRQSLDGYASDITVSEHYNQFSQAIQDIVSVIDGYSTDIEFAGLTNTVTENNNQQQQINQSIRQALDGYAQDSTESEHYLQLSQAIRDITSVIDGYSTDVEFAGLSNTELEHTTQQSQINQSILQALDGYASVPDTNAIGDGYVAFFIDGGRKIAGDNDLYFDRVNNQLQVSNFKLTTIPADGYVLTSDVDGNASWKLSPGAHDVHRALDQLVHNISEDSFEEYTYSGAFVTNITVWNDSTKTIKIREEQFTYSGAFVSQIITIQYNGAGIEAERTTELYTYSGGFITNITRTLT